MLQSKTRITITPAACVYLALSFVLIPLPIQLSWIGAVVFHELCHILAVTVLRKRILGFQISVGGVKIFTDGLSNLQEVLCALAGPVGSLVLVLFRQWFPHLAIFGLIHAMFNMLPLTDLDGGRVLSGILNLCARTADVQQICRWVDRITRILLCVFCLWVVWKLSWIPFIFLAVGWLLKRKNRKYSCKQPAWKVQ